MHTIIHTIILAPVTLYLTIKTRCRVAIHLIGDSYRKVKTARKPKTARNREVPRASELDPLKKEAQNIIVAYSISVLAAGRAKENTCPPRTKTGCTGALIASNGMHTGASLTLIS